MAGPRPAFNRTMRPATGHDPRDFLFADSSAARPPPNHLTLPILCAAVLVAEVDFSVVNLATKPIGEHFGAGVGVRQWLTDSYNLI
jgi:hypothetical protein